MGGVGGDQNQSKFLPFIIVQQIVHTQIQKKIVTKSEKKHHDVMNLEKLLE